jgi:hypothetical protein
MKKKADERAGFAAAYREGLGLAAIAVLCDGEGTRIVALSPGEDVALSAGESAEARWWCRRADDAARVAASAGRMLRRESNGAGGSADASRAEAAVLAAAKKLNVALHSEQDIGDAAMTIAARVDAELQQQHESGGLKSINKAYRSYRLDSSARGERVLRYDEWMRKYREKLVRQIASALRQI